VSFALPPNNRDQPNEVLLEDLRAVSKKCGGVTLTRETYAQHGRFAPATIASRFGGWGRALEAAGLASARHFGVTEAEAIADLRRVAAVLSAETLSLEQYKQHGRFSAKPVERNFGSWVQALRAAGLKVSEKFHERVRS
jgi:hypothetical protein